MFTKLASGLYSLLMVGACVAMVAAFVCIGLGVLAREVGWNIQGLDAYAGYAIAAALFLALPATFKHGDHIRVTLIASRLGNSARRRLEHACMLFGTLLSGYVAYFAYRLVWVSYSTHDVSQAVDATALWIPQLFMAIGAVGFSISFIDAWAHHTKNTSFFAGGDEPARVE